jgi:NitT/TauT family transport system permease protein
MLDQWFKLRGKIEGKASWVYTLIGFAITICIWWILAEFFSTNKPILNEYNSVLPSSIDSVHLVNRDSIIRVDEAQLANATKFEKVYPLLPRPDKVLLSFKDLFQKDKLVPNTLHSIWLNIQGYFWAIFLAIPIGLIIGLFPIFNSMFNKQIDSLRYLPLSALTGLFIIWFGLGDPMKIAFLAVGILVYLIPVVVQRIQDLEEVYPQTAYTMGASKWQLIKNVFLPGIFGKLIDDIRVLTAISWTYIIIAELLNKEAGIGSLIYTKSRQGQIDKVFALLIVIIIIGLIQDKLFALFDRMINPYKYYKTKENGLAEGRIGVAAMVIAVICGILCSYFLKISIMCTIAWLLFAAGLLAIIYSYFLLSKTSSK